MSTLASDVKIHVLSDIPTGIYEPGQQVTWEVTGTDGQNALAGSVGYRILQGGFTQGATGTLTLKDGKASVSSTRNSPGVILLEATWKGEQGPEVKALGGAVFAPEKISPSEPCPADFDAFWAAKLAELERVPMGANVERVDSGDEGFEYFKVTLDNIRGTKVYGQLAKPRGQTKLPAIIQFQWGGVYGFNKSWVLGNARKGWLAMNISVHDLPIDMPESFYQEKERKELSGYYYIGQEDRETGYYLRVLLGCYRAIEFLKQHPDWNGQALVASGSSQGGYQSIAAAGLHPGVTAMTGVVPSICDMNAPEVAKAAAGAMPDETKVKSMNTWRYFDAMNFARRVKCPALIGLGLLDTGCHAAGILAMFNQLQGPKELVIMPKAGHGGDQSAYGSAAQVFLERHK